MRTAVLAGALLAAIASSARAGISMTIDQPSPSSSDVVVRWEAEGPGPFTILMRDTATPNASDHLPLDWGDAVATGLTGGRAVIDDATTLPPLSGQRLVQVRDESDGSCSNLGVIARRRVLRGGTVAILPMPARRSVLTLGDVLDAHPEVVRAELFDPIACRRTTLTKVSALQRRGIDAFIPPDAGVLVRLGRDAGLVVVGASASRHEGTLIATNGRCPLPTVLALPFTVEWKLFDEALCGTRLADWTPDAIGNPTSCPAGAYDGMQPATVTQGLRDADDIELERTVTTLADGLLFQGPRTTIDPVGGLFVRMGERSWPRIRRLATTDLGADEACRCADSDGDGDDDCSERLYGTDPADPSIRGPESDGDGVPDDADDCPGHPDPLQEDRDGDGFGDACDPDPADPENRSADADGDGILDGHDGCPDHPDDGLDRDGDGLPDRCDPCPDRAVFTGDQDGDGLGNACDPCPDDAVPDSDRDGLCSDDNCPFAANPNQRDDDRDGFGDACECPGRAVLAGHPGLHVSAVGGSAAAFRELTWPAAPGGWGAVVYDVAVGPLAPLSGRGDVSATRCLADGLTDTRFVDGMRRGSHFYLVRRRTACTVSSWGRSTDISRDPRASLDEAGSLPCP